ncbi:MAG: hypothetical protein ABL927_08275 [Bdellovibrionales bacterium]
MPISFTMSSVKVLEPKFQVAAPEPAVAVLEHQRRRVPQISIDRRVGLLISGTYVLGKAIELGEEGMKIESPIEIKMLQKLVVTLRIPEFISGVMIGQVSEHITGQAHVQESEQSIKERMSTSKSTHTYAVQFVNLDFDIKRKIRNFVASGKSKPL